MKILGIESSADETSASVVEDGSKLLSNEVASSIDLNIAYGGIVPEIAARSHLEVITPVIKQALATANCRWSDIDAIAVTQGPGLSGSLLIGVVTAKTLATVKHKPLYPINHVKAHIYANFITKSPLAGYTMPSQTPSLPMLALIVSGGHSHIIFLENDSKYQVVGRALDDAVGEAFDKVAKMIGLPYPGGPSISKLAQEGDPEAFKLPIAHTAGPYDFSFSGLKTAVLRAAQTSAGYDYTLPSWQLPSLLTDKQKADLAASFQSTALLTLIDKLAKAVDEFQPASVVIGGGVAASSALRQLVSERLAMEVEYADPRLCTDNGAMISALGYRAAKAGQPPDINSWDVAPGLSL